MDLPRQRYVCVYLNMKTLGAIWLYALLLLPPSGAQTERADTDSQLETYGNNNKAGGGQTSTLTSNTVTNTMRKRSAAASPDPALDIVIEIVKDIDANIDLDLDLDLPIDFTLNDDDDDASVSSTAGFIQRRWGGGGYERASAARPAVSAPGYTAGGGYWDHYNSGYGPSSGAPAGVDHTQGIPVKAVSVGYESVPSGASGGTKTRDNSPPSSSPPRQPIPTNGPTRENDGGAEITVTITSTQAQTQTKTMTISSVSGSRHPSKRWTVPE